MSEARQERWFVDRELGRTTISTESTRQVAIFTVTDGDRRTAEARALLGAAAPALYAAAVSTLQRLEADPEQKDGFAARMLRSAVAQAEGRQP